jgi:L-iditol 2-dehydrogenase
MELDRHGPTIRLVRAVVLDADGRPQLAEIDPPAPSLRVLACGLCGSDVEKLGRAAAGTVLGHEVVVRDGDRRLALVHHLPCGECERCLAGHESTCERFAAATIVPGGFAERVAPGDGVDIPDALDDARATMVEPLACVLRGAERVPRGRVLVVGNGFVGRLFGAVLARRGDDVFAADADPARAGRAPDGPVDAVVVCARGAGRDALDAVSPGGTVLVFADAGTLPADEIYRRELTVLGSRSATPASMHAAAQLLPELDVPEPTVLPLDRFDEGLRLFLERRALKVVFTP